MMINDNRADILSRLDAMLVKEATANTRCYDYFERARGGCIDDLSRKAMVTWIQNVQQLLALSPDTVCIAMSIFDRYLCSGRGGAVRALEDECKFQLAAITSFYTAVKIHEPVVLGIDMLLVVCRHAYTEDEFESMEMDILSAIGWRVSCHTAIDYARALLELIREDECLTSVIVRSLLSDCERQMGVAIADIRFSCLKQSELGTRWVAISVAENECLSLSEKEAVLTLLSESCDINPSSIGGVAPWQYLAHSSPCKSNIVSKLGVSSQQQPSVAISNYSNAGSSSPTSIFCRTARQA